MSMSVPSAEISYPGSDHEKIIELTKSLKEQIGELMFVALAYRQLNLKLNGRIKEVYQLQLVTMVLIRDVLSIVE